MSEQVIYVYLHENGEVALRFEGFTTEEGAEVLADAAFIEQMVVRHEEYGDFSCPKTLADFMRKKS